MSSQFLYEQIESVKLFGFGKELPQYITNNLSERIKLREYQKEAINNTLIYLDGPLSKNKQIHILYHMATGSGKTLIMAMNMLYYYKKGYRNFLFFTNRNNIISKTKINFLEKNSSKYLFSNKINIDGNNIDIKEVKNFQSIDKNAINICFDTTSGIHYDLSLVKEGSLTIEDFENQEIVLFADEAHHLNATTSKDKEENKINLTWENTVNTIFRANKNNVLLEYTATCDLQDENVKNKYLDKIIFNFDLKEFRKAGYTKEFANFPGNSSKWIRTLRALIMSEYRKMKFIEHNVDINPVVLLKSQTIKESEVFYKEFFDNMKKISVVDISEIRKSIDTNTLLKNAFIYFENQQINDTKLIDLIKQDFNEENSVNMNNEKNVDNERVVNNLDEKGNQYRLIFIVDKLTEGWDVLSLFDIVRLYETRQGGPKGVVSKYTISEAQLIGRGARYCPFKLSKDDVSDKRKYSDEWNNETAICETLLYHCMQDSRYIDELKRALKETGLLPNIEPLKVEYLLKESFKSTEIYKNGYVFLNERIEVDKKQISSLPDKIIMQNISYYCNSSMSTSSLLFENRGDKIKSYRDLAPIQFNKIGKNISYKAYRSFEALSFDKLIRQFPNLKSIEEFLYSDKYLGAINITYFCHPGEKPTTLDQLCACKKVLEGIVDYINKLEINYIGSKEFKAHNICEKFTNRTRLYNIDENYETWGNGIAQMDSRVDSRYRLDLSNKDWYAYNENFGTSEEKKFVKYFSAIVTELNKKYQEIYLIRNELQIAIYSFSSGAKFEPDFLLILKKNEENKNQYLNIFVEPKGEHLLEKDNWKNRFLLELEANATPVIKFTDDNEYKIWGTPLYNESATKKDFQKYFTKII